MQITKFCRTLVAAAVFSASQVQAAEIPTFSLDHYRVSHVWNLPSFTAAEASAVTYNWDTDTLFVLGDEGEALVEVSKTGQQLSVMYLASFDDTEGLAYVGGGQFVITEERLRDAYQLTYAAGQSVDRSAMPSADLGITVGNVGIEGISFDRRDGSFITVKEKTPQQVNFNQITFGTPGSVTSSSLFTPNLGVLDLSDVQIIGNSAAFAGSAAEDHLLLFSQESSRLLHVDRQGNLLSSLDFSLFSDSAEGVTMDDWGNIFLVDENGDAPRLFELTQVPVPAAIWLFGSCLLTLFGMHRRRQRAVN